MHQSLIIDQLGYFCQRWNDRRALHRPVGEPLETYERYALQRLEACGAPGRRSGEAGAAYVRRLQDEGWLRPARHPGSMAFTWDVV